jgi:catechol 2,3-dioxygenase-like lactoylglutathione lyase family enzyme
MTRLLHLSVITVFALTAAPRASAQLLVAKDGPVVYGHHHLNTTNIAAQKKFFVDTLGGTVIKIGSNQQEIVEFPNVLIFFRTNQAPSGGTRGTTVNHIGFTVPDLRPVIDKIKANGFQMITRAETLPTDEVKDDIAIRGNTRLAFALGPDDVKVELIQAAAQKVPITLNHIHFFHSQNTEMRDWYAKVFGAKPRETPNFAAADLPGVALNFTKSPDPVVGTQGRALDHIGFEVKNLEEFTKKLEGMGIKLERPYTKVAALNIAIAFIKDPWGTYIELTEGLDKVS